MIHGSGAGGAVHIPGDSVGLDGKLGLQGQISGQLDAVALLVGLAVTAQPAGEGIAGLGRIGGLFNDASLSRYDAFALQKCKNYSAPLGNTPVQEVSAGKMFYNCHVGVVLTNSTFTHSAISLAEATGVLLWDRTELAKLMEKW